MLVTTKELLCVANAENRQSVPLTLPDWKPYRLCYRLRKAERSLSFYNLHRYMRKNTL